MKLTNLFSRLGFADRSRPILDEADLPPEAYTIEDQNRLFIEGCDLIRPYMHVHDAKARPVNTEAAEMEVERGLALLLTVVEINPENWSAYWFIGKGYQALHDSEEACDAFARSFAIQRNHTEVAREYMAECLKLGRASEAIEIAVHAVGLKPDDAGLVANLALAYLIGGRIDDAIVTVNRSLDMAPDDQVTRNLENIILEVQDGTRPQPSSMRDLNAR